MMRGYFYKCFVMITNSLFNMSCMEHIWNEPHSQITFYKMYGYCFPCHGQVVNLAFPPRLSH